MKNLLFEDKAQIQRTEHLLKQASEALNNFKNDFNALPGLANKISHTDQLFNALQDPKGFYEDSVKDQMPLEEYGLPVNREAKLKTLQLPDLSDILQTAKQISNGLTENKINKDVFEIGFSGSISVNKEAKEILFDSYRVYATSKIDQELFDKQKQLVKSFIEMEAFYKANFSPMLFQPNNFNMFALMKEGKADIEFYKYSLNHKLK